MRSTQKNYLAISLFALALLLLPFAGQFPVRVVAQGKGEPDGIEELRRLDPDKSVTAIFEFDQDPVVVRQRIATGLQAESGRVDVTSSDARAYETALAARQQAFKSEMSRVAPRAVVRTQLRKIANAVSVKAPASDLVNLAQVPGVARVHIIKTYHKTLDKSVPLINAPALWAAVGGAASAGAGVKIAILDTGIDPNNPLFSDAKFSAPAGFPKGDPNFTNNKIIVAEQFLGDSTETPADEEGHGTNVAGIAAGDLNTQTPLGPITGVAPAAFLGNYRVLDASGSGTDDLIATGLEQALSDGFDVANLSLGGTASATLGFLDDAVDNAVAAGMVVCVAAGNDGDKGQMSIDSPGVAPLAISVAAASNAHSIGSGVSVTGPGQIPANLSALLGVPGSTCGAVFSAASQALFDVSALDGKKRACKAKRLPAGTLTGKIALIQRGNCTFADKINDAAGAGAVGAIVYNQDLSENSDGGDNLVSMDTTGTSIPSVFVDRTDGLNLQAWIAAHPSATVQVGTTIEAAAAGDVLASFSSIGPTVLGTLKPDIAAPGVNIYSGAFKGCNGDGVSDPTGFIAISGTSQATPHVAGSAALLLQLHPSWTPAQIKSALVNSANSSAVVTAIGSSTVAGVLNVGGGRVDLSKAMITPVTTSPASLGFGLNNIKAAGSVNLSLDLNITSQSATQQTFAIQVSQVETSPKVQVSASATQLLLAPGQSGRVTVSFAASKGAPRGDYTGYVLIKDSSGNTAHVPFWGRI